MSLAHMPFYENGTTHSSRKGSSHVRSYNTTTSLTRQNEITKSFIWLSQLQLCLSHLTIIKTMIFDLFC